MPFCWDDKPGVRKALHHNTMMGSVEAVPQSSSPPTTTTTDENHLEESSATEDVKIPMPPCRPQPPPPRRSAFWKGFGRQHDPFLVAYKHCTKTPSSSTTSKSKLGFSCKSSVDARDDHFRKPSMPPHLPHSSNPSSSSNT